MKTKSTGKKKSIKKIKVPIYHESYTSEQNEMVHAFFATASEDDLLEAIEQLIKMYPDTTHVAIDAQLHQLFLEIRNRDAMKQAYDLILACKCAWDKYLNDLYNYLDVLEIRSLYAKFKENEERHEKQDREIRKKKRTTRDRFEGTPLDRFYLRNCTKNYLIGSQSLETLRKYIFSENAKYGIKRPVAPATFYHDMSEVPITLLDLNSSLKTWGRDNLQLLAMMLLSLLDSPKENLADTLLLFWTRIYSRCSHTPKKKVKLLQTRLEAYDKLKDRNDKMLSELKDLKEDALQQEKRLPD